MNTTHTPRMVISDLDGTLLHSDRTFGPTNLTTLEKLGRRHILRVIATGRSLYSAHKVLPPKFPLDYLVFSSGAGILEWRTQQLLVAHHLTAKEIALASGLLIESRIDFMLHHPIPDNHHFFYYSTGQGSPDFIRRCKLYQPFATPLQDSTPLLDRACQFVAIASKERIPSQYETLKAQLNMLKVIRATSPLDGESLWIEIFPQSVSKALAGNWLAQQHAIKPSEVLAIGNDYNDLDLLQWAGKAIVVRNAPSDLRQIYSTVASNNDDGFSEAVKNWIKH